MPLIDLHEKRFGRLTVVALAAKRGRQTFWLCHCDCGLKKEIYAGSLRSGDTRSCGCLSKELTILRSTKHGMARAPGRSTEFNIWRSMKQRCYDPSGISYKYYGARGVRICERWLNDFTAFYADMGPRPSLKHSIDRIDNDGDYEPVNCRWATSSEQRLNQRPRVSL